MPTIPVRGLAQYGVIADSAATDIPPNAWTMARNCRFIDGRISRAPVYRTLLASLMTTTPCFMSAVSTQSASDALFYTDVNGRIYRRLTTGAHADVSALAHADTDAATPSTLALINEFTIINRATEQPWVLSASGSLFEAMPAWDQSHTANAVRQYKDFLVALSVSKSGTRFPNMVKTSDAAEAGAMPQSWDHTDPTNLATENPLTQLTTALVDGCVLGDDMILYTSDQVWRMSLSNDEFVFAYRNTTVTGGVINVNCVVEHGGQHFVFGVDDIYVHDSVTRVSIADERVRELIFGQLDRDKVDRCFVFIDKRSSTIRFFYPSSSADAYWANPTQCNMSASYCLKNKTWQFEDQPNVCGVALANPSTVYTYDTYPGTFDDATDTFSTITESDYLVPILGTAQLAGGSSPSITARAYVHDLMGSEARLPGLSVDTAITPPAVLQKTYVDLDDLGLALIDYKEIRRLVPQISVTGDGTFTFRIGYQTRLNKAISWDPYVTYDPEDDDTVDFMDAITGTYPGGKLVSLEVRFEVPDEDFRFTAYDIDITSTSHK